MSATLRPDSIFTWIFQADSGVTWGGTLVDDTDRYDPGAAWRAAAGTYRILAEDPRGTDLSALGLEEGRVSVDWYRTAGGDFLVTRAGPAAAAGLGGLGSEEDAAWTGTAWSAFGRGGAWQAGAARLADAAFGWRFTAASGDQMWGTLHAPAGDYAPGDTIATARGSYVILTETPIAAGSEPDGQVFVTRYRDALSGLDLSLESGGTVPAGVLGLGSEMDRAWDGAAWQAVGQGGTWQADARLVQFAFTFRAASGDAWEGRVLDWGPRYGPGSQIVTPHGRYEIGAVSPWDGAAGTPAGTVWITAYSDAGALGGPVSLTVQSGAARGGAPAAGLGLGNEVEYAWNGSAWAAFGEGGARQVNADLRQSFFAWYFQANSGDLYTGWLIDLSWKAQAGDTQTTPAGRFVIQQETEFGRDIGVQNGTVWTTGYFDSASASWLPTRNYYQLAASSGQAGLGSELDTAWDGTAWQLFGQGGARQVDKLPPDSFYGWYFQARSGDLYMGFTIDLTSRWQPGDRITTPYGQYVIESEAEYGWTTGLGRTVWTTAYFDAGTSRWLSTQNYYVYRGSSSQAGLGQELDHAWDGAAWQLFGQGGLYQANGLPGAASDPFG